MKIKRTQIFKFILSGLVVAVGLLLVIFFSRPQAAGDLKVYFLDIGQGDASYIKNPDGTDILIDGGPDNSVLNQLDKVMNFGDREINLVILSHPHADHVTGLIEVLNRYRVDETNDRRWSSNDNCNEQAWCRYRKNKLSGQWKLDSPQTGGGVFSHSFVRKSKKRKVS